MKSSLSSSVSARLSAGVCALALVVAANVPASAQSVLKNQLLAKAQNDECFVSLASPLNLPLAQNPCTDTGNIKKVDQAYAWGMTKIASSKRVWFGTAANVECIVLQYYLGLTDPLKTNSYACEFSQSQFAKNFFAAQGKPVPANFMGDWRPPKLYAYNYGAVEVAAGSAPADAAALVDMGATMDPASQRLLASTLGIRSAGSTTIAAPAGDASTAAAPRIGVVFLAGPSLTGKSINLFAFKDTGEFIASKEMTAYNDIRQWIVVKNQLYTGVRSAKDGSGAILRWAGDATPANVFKFRTVGVTDSEVAYFAATTGANARLYVTTWGGLNTAGIGQVSAPQAASNQPQPAALPLSGVWVSPVLPAGGALPPSTAAWTKIWDVSKYETDPKVALTIFGGAISSFNNQVTWGMMQVPFTALLVTSKACPGALSSSTDALVALARTTRAIPIFSADGSGEAIPTATTLRYGSNYLYSSTCVAGTGGNTLQWTQTPNASGQQALNGAAGFGNPFNTYTWASAVYRQKLYFGTFDWSYLAADGLPLIAKALGINLSSNAATILTQLMAGGQAAYGADLWRFDAVNGAAVAESSNGLGNNLNYGIRTMIGGTDFLFAGTANPMNLKTTSTTGVNGGWELRKLQPK